MQFLCMNKVWNFADPRSTIKLTDTDAPCSDLARLGARAKDTAPKPLLQTAASFSMQNNLEDLYILPLALRNTPFSQRTRCKRSAGRSLHRLDTTDTPPSSAYFSLYKSTWLQTECIARVVMNTFDRSSNNHYVIHRQRDLYQNNSWATL